MEWSVEDPDGRVHTKRSKAKVFTHAVIRRNVGSDHFFANWATSLERAKQEARVHLNTRDYVSVVALKQEGT